MSDLQDHGQKPYVLNIEEDTKANTYFRVTKWTGTKMQMTLMSIEVGGEIGLEIHPDVEQFLRIDEGEGEVYMGEKKDELNFREKVSDGYAIFIPKNTWHNVKNTGKTPLKLYSIYALPDHKPGTIHKTFEDAQKEEK